MDNTLKIGDIVEDKDGTHGKVVDISKDGEWIQYECRPHLYLSNLLCDKKETMQIRKFGTLRRNLIKI